MKKRNVEKNLTIKAFSLVSALKRVVEKLSWMLSSLADLSETLPTEIKKIRTLNAWKNRHKSSVSSYSKVSKASKAFGETVKVLFFMLKVVCEKNKNCLMQFREGVYFYRDPLFFAW